MGDLRTRVGDLRYLAVPSAHYLDTLSSLRHALIAERRRLTPAELAEAAGVPDEAVPSLAALAHEVRLEWCGPTVEIEGILSAKTGGCPEDCHFCSQSSRFESPVLATPFLDTGEVLAAAKETAALGATEFCIVLAVRGPDERTMQRILDLVPLVQAETGLNVAVSAGILADGQAQRLAAGGVHRYNHNLETARSYFDQIVTTHSWDERWGTCREVQEAGMELCCGVLLGMGESDEQRLELITPAGRPGSGRSAPQLPRPPAGDPAGYPPAGAAARGAALDRPVPPGPARSHPALRRGPGDDPGRTAGHGYDRGDQRPDRGQLPDYPGPVPQRRSGHAAGFAHADRGAVVGHMTFGMTFGLGWRRSWARPWCGAGARGDDGLVAMTGSWR